MYPSRFIPSLLVLGTFVVACGSAAAPAVVPISPTPASNISTLQIFTEEYPPVTFSQEGKATGLGTEIVEEIMRRQGVSVNIQVVPWARGYQTALEGPMTGLFATMRTEERERLFKWVGPLTEVNTSFYALKDSGITLASLEEAHNIPSIGVPREYYSHQYLQQAAFTNLDEVVDPDTMVKKLLAGRNPLMVNDNITLPQLLQQNGATIDDVELVYTFMTSKNYLAFSLDTPDALVAEWQATLDAMRADGTVATIYTKWLPGERPPEKDVP